jgi:hypothetical protein
MAGLSIVDALIALGIGAFAAVAGGAFGGVRAGGKTFGNELAAMMGAFYGPLAGSGGIAVALVAVKLVSG